MQHLTDSQALEDAARHLQELIEAHGEWFYSPSADEGRWALSKDEMEFRVAHARLIFSCWTEKGTRCWRVLAWQWTGAKLMLDAERGAGARRSWLELIPRASVDETQATVSAARRERGTRLAQLACAVAPGARVERLLFNAGTRRGEPGCVARILLRQKRERIAVTGRVTAGEAIDADAVLSSALLWFKRLSERARPPYIQRLWIIAERRDATPLAERIALLCQSLRQSITLYELDEEWRTLRSLQPLELEDLLLKHGERFHRPPEPRESELAATIKSIVPDAIDVVRTRRGETLRFHGLPFARVRRLPGTERVWFGVEGARRRRLLDVDTEREWDRLLTDLIEHRRADSPDPHHALSRASPEAWLESLLRRDITQLDPGLVIAPLYAQFRAAQQQSGGAGARPVDLLALRRDGRVVVIELKISEAIEHVLQGADYWRRVEAERRSGALQRSRLFGDARISDEPVLVYLVAPLLRFHSAFKELARMIDARIEVYRFEINEDWRTRVRVVRRISHDELLKAV